MAWRSRAVLEWTRGPGAIELGKLLTGIIYLPSDPLLKVELFAG